VVQKVVIPIRRPGLPCNPEGYKELGAEFVGIPCQTEDEIIAATADASAVFAILQDFNKRVIDNMKQCRIICCVSIGYGNVDLDAATQNGILVTNVPDYCLEEVSDHTMALLLACARKIVPQIIAVKEGKWVSTMRLEFRDKWPPMFRLRGQSLGLVGFGRIARILVPKAKGFGLRVIAYDPYIPKSVGQELGVELVEFDYLLKESDFISLHSNLTDETKHMMGLEQFKKMKPTAYLINVSRGGLIDEQALYIALTHGYIAGAGLDVTEPEPPDRNHPLFKLENVLITPHSAFYSDLATSELSRRAEEEVFRVLRGEWPQNLLNPQVKKKYMNKWGKGTGHEKR
jgi:D-3-phosphoglycerate dehydrogenase